MTTGNGYVCASCGQWIAHGHFLNAEGAKAAIPLSVELADGLTRELAAPKERP